MPRYTDVDGSYFKFNDVRTYSVPVPENDIPKFSKKERILNVLYVRRWIRDFWLVDWSFDGRKIHSEEAATSPPEKL